MEEAARLAHAGDVDTVAALAGEGRAAVHGARGGDMWLRREAAPEPVEAAVHDFLNDENATVVVGTIDGVVLGFMLVRVVSDSQGRVADIAELYVTPEARGVGLGEHMMGAVEAWAAEQNCSGLSSRALPGDRATKNFFETHGLVARSIEVYRSDAT